MYIGTWTFVQIFTCALFLEGDLVNDNTNLQEMAATTDNLLSVLSEFFLNKPDEDDEATDETTIQLYNNLCKVSCCSCSFH